MWRERDVHQNISLSKQSALGQGSLWKKYGKTYCGLWPFSAMWTSLKFWFWFQPWLGSKGQCLLNTLCPFFDHLWVIQRQETGWDCYVDSIKSSKRTHPTWETYHLATMEAYSMVPLIESKGQGVCRRRQSVKQYRYVSLVLKDDQL